MSEPRAASGAALPQDPTSAAWPDAAVIARLANALFQAPPNQAPPSSTNAPLGAQGIPLAPQTPITTPAPTVTTSAAPWVPGNPSAGPPDLPPTTIPSVVPTPSVTAPQPPSQSSLPPGLELPQPGSSPGAIGPQAIDLQAIDLQGAPQFNLGDAVYFAPPDRRALDAAPGRGAAGDEPAAYFLSEAPFASHHAPQPPTPQSARPPSATPTGSGDPTPLDAVPTQNYFLNADATPQPPRPDVGKPSADFAVMAPNLRPVLTPAFGGGAHPFDPHAIKRDFPILQTRVHGKRLVWLDNAATTQKPQAVIDRLSQYYTHENSNIHRAAHELAARSTDAFEAAREKVRRFLGAPSPRDIIFVRGATEGINLVAQAWGRRNIGEGDEIVVSWLEHHANIVPWQQLCAEKGARLRVAPVDDHGQIILEEYEKLLGPRTKLVSMTQVSNALGTIVPVTEITAIAHRHGACVLIDGAQSVSHMPVDVQAIGCDFFVFSGHKLFAPTGIGAVYGKESVLAQMPPWQGGGNMIADVTFEKTLYQGPPDRFEAGTANIADAVGLGAAIDYLQGIGMEVISRYEHELHGYATERMLGVPGLKMIGTAKDKASVLSFVLDGHDPVDVGKALDQDGIAVRAGHHCAQPILRRFGLEATVRPSLAFYNTCEDVDALVAALKRLQSGAPRGRVG
ncbi:cysteine desulfurase/selenocysteine lyase [Rhodopseudomonas rhenobacensis]|uniref:Cysteine desulfurase n=1 Tax=Rhodopseudomonas rhenobacensis TaxID=87461 RepID=A0A7W7Z5T8_9BRAD|nr:family 2A encapsulin nanocompartment cargo protein cysteine desulfurase [Rhodopseudomonas rhenobacensis]MBB5048300.1 cysteine desulfurase/selenocysteine lyase [Rhodopseudomonas rhenobacensis]